MATITTTVTPTQRYTPFTGLDELQRAASGIARAEDVRRASGTWSGPGAGNDREINFDHALDPDYGYIVMDCFAKFYAQAELTIEAVANFQIQTTPGHSENEYIETQMISTAGRSDTAGTAIGSITSPRFNTFRPGGHWQGAGSSWGSMTFRLAEPKPSMLIFPFAKTQYPPRIVVTFGDQFLGAGDLDYYFYLRLLQYDISQGYNYVIQTPQLTR